MRSVYLLGLMILLLSGVLLAAPVKREVKETKIIDIDPATIHFPAQGALQWSLPSALYPSPDMRHVTYVFTEGEKSCLVRDGVRGTLHDKVRLQDTSLTSDGHFYCWLCDGEQWMLVFDDKEYTSAAPMGLTPIISPDGKHIAYVGRRKGNDRCVVLDGVEGKWYYNEIAYPVFSPDSQHFAYGAFTGMNWVVVVDGKELPGKQFGINGNIFSPDSKHFASILLVDDKFLVQIDGERGQTYDRIDQFRYTASGQTLLVAKTGDKWELIIDDKARELPGYSRELVMSADEKHMAYLTGTFRKTAAVVDGVTGPEYMDIRFGPNPFSDDGKLSYTARKDGGMVKVTDGKETPLGIELALPVSSPDGKRQANRVVEGNQAKVVLDGVDGALYDYIGTPTFSSDSQHIAYFARLGNQTMLVIDGQEGSKCEALISPRFSYRRPMDPRADPTPMSPIINNVNRIFTKENQVSYLIYRDKAIYLVEETLK